MTKKSITEKTKDAATQLELELVQYKLGNDSINFNIDIDQETVWATEDQIASLFDSEKSAIANHINSVFENGELDKDSVMAKFTATGLDGESYEIMNYNLDMILSVGYRVRSPQATEFRKWATSILRAYIVDGYAINEVRLRDDPMALQKVAAHIRKLRAEEQNIYEAVRDCFKDVSIDYDSKSEECRKFYALLQDKFHYAIHQKTSAEVILDRANHKEPNMGVRTFKGNMPSLKETKIGKNYLDSDELYVLHILCEQFLLYAESKAIRGQSLTMSSMHIKLDELLSVNEYPVFKGYKKALRQKAVEHAKVEYALWLRRMNREDKKMVA